MRAIVITGTSTGIGYATAKYCIKQGVTVFGSVHTATDVDRLTKELGPRFVPLLFDITEEEKVKQSAALVRQQLQGNTLWGLINNAATIVLGPLLYMPVKDFSRQLEVNLVGQLIVTQAFAPLLGVDPNLKGPPGKIINISSVLGKYTYPFATAYAITKHGIEAFSEGLRRELIMFGIDVITVGPGAIRTPLFDKMKNYKFSPEAMSSAYGPLLSKSKQVTAEYEKSAWPTEKIATLIYSILEQKHPKVRYSPTPNKFVDWIMLNFPKRLLDKMIAKQMGLIKK